VAPPFDVRIDLHEWQAGGYGVFVTLDSVFGVGPNLTVSWALPPAAVAQTSFTVQVTQQTDSANNASGSVVLSKTAASSAQLFSFPRAALAPASVYDVSVSATVTTSSNGSSQATGFSRALRFATSAGAALWAQSAPIWAPKCASAPGPAQPQYTLYFADAKVPVPAASNGVLSALLYVTAAPPIYNDPWNVTKLFSGFKLYVNNSLIGVGPGHTACGPYAMSSCTPVQPVDGFDITDTVRGLLAQGQQGVLIDVVASALKQDDYALAPGMQAVLSVRFSPAGSAPDLVIGTQAGSATWSSLDGDGVYNPAGNKDSGWYTQPREDINTACIPDKSGSPSAGCAAPYGACTWAAPVAAPGAFGMYPSGTLGLAGKSTQALFVASDVGFATATKLGPGWWLLDPGFELQGGFALRVAATAAAPGGVRAVVQLSDQLQANGSAMWNTRAGMHYRDTWTFPSPAASPPWWQLEAEHHEMCEFRYAELILTDATTGAPLDLDPATGDIAPSLWVNRYRYDDFSATRVQTTSPELDSVFRFAAFTLKTTSMDIYSDSNTRQRSFDCMADNNVAALNHYSSTSELALPRMMSAQVMAIGETGYISGNWSVRARSLARARARRALALHAHSLRPFPPLPPSLPGRTGRCCRASRSSTTRSTRATSPMRPRSSTSCWPTTPTHTACARMASSTWTGSARSSTQAVATTTASRTATTTPSCRPGATSPCAASRSSAGGSGATLTRRRSTPRPTRCARPSSRSWSMRARPPPPPSATACARPRRTRAFIPPSMRSTPASSRTTTP
jgi:hypothetical protein